MNTSNRLYFSWLLAILTVLMMAFVPETSSYLFKPVLAKWQWLLLVCMGFQAITLGIAAFHNWGWALRLHAPISLIGAVLAVVNLTNGQAPAVFGVSAALILLMAFLVQLALQFPATEKPAATPVHPALALAGGVAVIATLGSLYYSEVKYFIPCTLCWYQRMMMYPLALLLPLGYFTRNAAVQAMALPLSILGLLIATYHVMEEKIPGFQPIKVCAPDNPCTTPWVNYWGFVTIPVMSLTAFLLITVLLVVARQRRAARTQQHMSEA